MKAWTPALQKEFDQLVNQNALGDDSVEQRIEELQIIRRLALSAPDAALAAYVSTSEGKLKHGIPIYTPKAPKGAGDGLEGKSDRMAL